MIQIIQMIQRIQMIQIIQIIRMIKLITMLKMIQMIEMIQMIQMMQMIQMIQMIQMTPIIQMILWPLKRLKAFHRLRYRLSVFLPPLPEVGCPIFLEIRNPWGKVMERSGLTFEHFCLEVV